MGVIPLDQDAVVLEAFTPTPVVLVAGTEPSAAPESVSITGGPVLLQAALDLPSTVLLGGESAGAAEIIAAGFRGPPGRDGNSGAFLLSMIAGETLGGHRAVYFDGQVVRYADYLDPNCLPVLGITEQAALAGDPVLVRIGGLLTGFPGSWETGPLFLTSQGLFSQTPPQEGYFVHIGKVWASTSTLQLDILPPIFLS